MATSPKNTDRRVQRTRQLLRQSAIEVMQEKGFTAMTIQDVTDRANLNRGTFYAHYVDKYALLEELIKEQFRKMLASKLPPTSKWNRQTLHSLILIVLEHFDYEYRQCDPTEIVDPLLERATKEELSRLLLEWLRQGNDKEVFKRVPVETVARVMSWAILGAATYWCQEATKVPAEQAASDVMLVIMEGVGHLVPDWNKSICI